MKTSILLVLVPLVSGLMSLPLVHAQEGHGHHAPMVENMSPHAAQLETRWESDVPLRTGMARIRIAVDALRHYEHGQMDEEHAVMLAERIQQQIAYLVANCKLAPQADAALHAIIGEIGAGAHSLKSDPADTGAIASMRAAVDRYPRQFDDPTWTGAGATEEGG